MKRQGEINVCLPIFLSLILYGSEQALTIRPLGPRGRAINNGKYTTWAADMFCLMWRRDLISASFGLEPTILGQIARTLITYTKFHVITV